MELEVDGDWPPTTAAGSGAQQRHEPVAEIFNLATQASKFDAAGDYIHGCRNCAM